MANLRTNNLSGEGGRNAYRGSVFFDGQNTRIEITASSDLALGSGDYTIEAWVRFSKIDTYQTIIDFRTNNGAYPFIVRDTDGDLYYFVNGSRLIDNIPARENNVWHHIAVVRSSGTTKFYLNGVSEGSASDSTTYIADQNVDIGASTNDNDFFGYISNLRITKEALYTSTFTPPYSELKVLSNTVLLCCQDSDDPTKEATGKTLTGYNGLSDIDLVKQQPKVIPPYGVDAGNTFDGAIAMNSSSWMYFPTGRTEERSRGRAVIGWANNPVDNGMDVFDIHSSGNSTEFGNLTSGNRWGSHAFSSTTRGLWAGGYVNTPASTFFNTIDFVTIATNGNPIDFGDTTTASYRSGCCSSSTRGIIALGFVAPAFGKVNTIDQVTIATLGNATNFGDLFQTRANMSSLSSPTRGIFAGGETPTYVNTIDYVTIASAGDASNFGDLNSTLISSMAMASNTRGIIGGGYPTPANTNVIDFITIASTGDASDFGDLTGLYSVGSATSNNTRGVFTGGYTAPSRHNLMEFVTISTTGNASDFGDMTYARRDFGACSDSHGGLS